jgi:acyl-coenzyme A synthetase/AMP-(fatty) acid ligase
LEAGGAFLVLELAYPPDLLADAIEDANPVVVVTNTAEAGKIKSSVQVIKVDKKESETADESLVDRLKSKVKDVMHSGESQTNGAAQSNETTNGANGHIDEHDLDRLCFVAYSSGTTGKPKGIANPHRASVLSYNLRFGISDVSAGDRVACNVFFVWEIIRPLLRGATVVTVPDEVSYDPSSLVDLLKSKHVTETLMTPTLLATVLARYPDVGSRLSELKTLWLNGEVVTVDLARAALKALPNTRLLNCYSACETHEIACGDIKEMLAEVGDNATNCPVGRPLEPEHIHIADEEGKQVEAGVTGELFVGGPMLARGYLNRPEATAEAFVANKFSSDGEGRLYRTGDLATLLPSGLLEISGRIFGMIKLRGYSVVPAKVERVVEENLAVKKCVVTSTGDGLERQLVAYIVKDQDAGSRPVVEIDRHGHSPDARKLISPLLAQYMLPTIWMEVESIREYRFRRADLERFTDMMQQHIRCPAKPISKLCPLLHLQNLALHLQRSSRTRSASTTSPKFGQLCWTSQRALSSPSTAFSTWVDTLSRWQTWLESAPGNLDSESQLAVLPRQPLWRAIFLLCVR